MDPYQISDHNKKEPRKQFHVSVGWYLGFIHKSKYIKKQKNSKSQKCDFLSLWERTLSLDYVSIKKWFGEVFACDVPLPVPLEDADVMYKAVKDCVQPGFSGDCLPTT